MSRRLVSVRMTGTFPGMKQCVVVCPGASVNLASIFHCAVTNTMLTPKTFGAQFIAFNKFRALGSGSTFKFIVL